MLLPLLVTLLVFQQYTAPEGPDGLVYRSDYPNTRFAVHRKGRWNAWKFSGFPGNGGQRVSLTPAEAAQVEAHLKKIAAIVESTPYAQEQKGWYADRHAGWINTRFPAPGFPLNRLPVQSYYSLFPFHLLDLKKTVNGVEQWVPDFRQETISMRYELNPEIPVPGPSEILRLQNDQGPGAFLLTSPPPETTFHGFPVYSGKVVIARRGRSLYRPVTVERALSLFLSLYQDDRKTAETRAAGNPPANADWYRVPLQTLADMERLMRSPDSGKQACFDRTPMSQGLYKARGIIRAVGATPSCQPIVEPDPAYFDPALPRTAPQLLTISFLDRCFDTTKTPPIALDPNNPIPHGCSVHRRIWDEMDWKALEAVLY